MKRVCVNDAPGDDLTRGKLEGLKAMADPTKRLLLRFVNRQDTVTRNNIYFGDPTGRARSRSAVVRVPKPIVQTCDALVTTG